MKGKKYYAVIADNGFLCSSNWKQVERLRGYFCGDSCKGYQSKEDAIAATRQGYNEKHQFHEFIGEIIVNIPRFTHDFSPLEIREVSMSYVNTETVNCIQQRSTSMVQFY